MCFYASHGCLEASTRSGAMVGVDIRARAAFRDANDRDRTRARVVFIRLCAPRVALERACGRISSVTVGTPKVVVVFLIA